MTTTKSPAVNASRSTQHAARNAHAWFTLALVLVSALIVISPLLQPGYFWGAHDARHDVYFIFQYDKSVQDGIWLPSWGPDWAFGYGYPFLIIYGPLATFVGELFHHFLGLGFEASVKAVLALSIVVSGLAMYGFIRSWLGRNPSTSSGQMSMPGAAPRPMKMSLRGAAQTRSSQDVRTQRRSNLRHAPGIASPKAAAPRNDSSVAIFRARSFDKLSTGCGPGRRGRLHGDPLSPGGRLCARGHGRVGRAGTPAAGAVGLP